jgi:peptidoglycan/xylan/chitin deacetylase (PgdA/CDA1 family)
LIAAFALFLSFPLALAAADDHLPTATVLCYHIVESPQDPRMEISRDAFRQQMRYLEKTGYSVIPLHDLYDFVAGKKASIPRNAVVITIDDGWRSTFTEVFPEMQRRNFPFTVFIYPKIIGQTSHALTWKQVKQMADAGVDIQSHSLSHPFLTQRRHAALDEKKYQEWLQNELAASKRVLEQQTGRAVNFLAYPYGDYDTRVAQSAARAGYSAALTCDFGRVKRGSDPLRMKRMIIEKRMDFAAFRHYLGNGPMHLQDVTPLPNQLLDPGQPVIVTARITDHKELDPKSVGMTLLSAVGASLPFSYDPQNGSISMTINGVKDALAAKTKYLRAMVWGTERKTGKRVEASLVFRLPEPPPPAIDPATAAPALVAPATIAAPGMPTVVTPAAVAPVDAVTPRAEPAGDATSRANRSVACAAGTVGCTSSTASSSLRRVR